MSFETGKSEVSTSGGCADDRPKSLGRLPILVIMHGEASSAGRIGQVLAQRGYALDCRKPRFGAPLPKTLAGHSGVVVFGGPMSCNDPDCYIKDEIDFVGVALNEQKPFMGVCLGAQMLAKHLGANVRKHPAGKVEIGYHALNSTAEGERLGPWPAHVYQWHREGLDLPAGATRLAEGAVFENQAFGYGTCGLGLQFHPEITYALVNRWTVNAKDWRDHDGAQHRAAQLENHLLKAKAVATWLGGLVDAWLGSRLQSAA